MEKFAKLIRIITVAPIMAFLLCTCLLFSDLQAFIHLYTYFLCLVFLCVVPALSYPIENKFHIYKRIHKDLSDREAERKFAIIFSLFSYIALTLLIYVLNESIVVKAMVLTYLFSGLFIFIFSIIVNINPSGHMCGVMGPIAFLGYWCSWWFLLLLLVLFVTIWSSLKLKRHTVFQLVVGAVVPVVSFILAILITL